MICCRGHRAAARATCGPSTSTLCRNPLQPYRVAAWQRKKDIIQTKLFVGNLSFDTTSEQLRDLFAELGEVKGVTVPTDRDTGRPRGFAFVELATPEAAAAAIEKLNGHELDGRALRVNEATERPSGGPGGFRPGGFGGGGGAAHRPRPKGSRRNVRARKRGF